MSEEGEAILKQMREGGFGASGYFMGSLSVVLDNILSPTADIEVTRKLARRVQAMVPAFKEGLALRLHRTDR